MSTDFEPINSDDTARAIGLPVDDARDAAALRALAELVRGRFGIALEERDGVYKVASTWSGKSATGDTLTEAVEVAVAAWRVSE
jgi:hypothetical protein